MCEIQQILYYNLPIEAINSRLNMRVKKSSRVDDTFETIKKRLSNYQDQTLPVYEYYRIFGKIREIDGQLDENEMYEATKRALFPQTNFVIGPLTSGKTTVCEFLAKRTNMKLINFTDFLKDNKLRGKDDETVTMALI